MNLPVFCLAQSKEIKKQSKTKQNKQLFNKLEREKKYSRWKKRVNNSIRGRSSVRMAWSSQGAEVEQAAWKTWKQHYERDYGLGCITCHWGYGQCALVVVAVSRTTRLGRATLTALLPAQRPHQARHSMSQWDLLFFATLMMFLFHLIISKANSTKTMSQWQYSHLYLQ